MRGIRYSPCQANHFRIATALLNLINLLTLKVHPFHEFMKGVYFF